MRKSVLTACGLVAAWCAPVAAQTCSPFTDIAASDPFCANVQWMYNRGVTLGCTATTYCPASAVTRLQMAAFMNRLGNVTFQQGGNAFGGPATLGTTDDFPLEIVLAATRVVRLERRDSAAWGANTVNVVMGHPENEVARVCPSVQACLGTEPPSGGTVLGGGISEGGSNRVTDHFGVVAGGRNNRAGNDNASSADAISAVVSGGTLNTASAVMATVGGGYANTASGIYSTVPGGFSNTAGGVGSFAAGSFASALADGCFVWADRSSGSYICTGDNAFTARAAGGVYFRTNAAATSGVDLFGGASAWSAASDRAMKDNVSPVDARDVLERLASLPIATWNYKSQVPAIRHMGPMAQDLHAAFGLGESDKHISTVDADGIALAAIQGLNAKVEALLKDKDARIAALEQRAIEVDALRAELDALRATIAVLVPGAGNAGRVASSR